MASWDSNKKERTMNGWKLWVVICVIVGAATWIGNANAYDYCTATGSLGPGNDTWVGTSFDDYCSGGDGDDNLAGKGDRDLLHGGAGSDYLQGDDGYDELHGDSGTFNRLYGNDGNDELFSINGNATDAFVGGAGNNICHGDWNRSTGAHDSHTGCDIMYWTYFG